MKIMILVLFLLLGGCVSLEKQEKRHAEVLHQLDRIAELGNDMSYILMLIATKGENEVYDFQEIEDELFKDTECETICRKKDVER